MQSEADPAWVALQSRLKQVRGPGYERMAELLRIASADARPEARSTDTSAPA